MADYTVPFAPTSYQPVARYTNPYVGSLLELMQQQSRAQADADTRRMQLAGQLWQNLAQAGSQTVQAMAEAPERRRQQQLAQMQFDQAVRQRDIQTAVDNIPTDASQWTTYLGGLKPFQANAVQAAMLQKQEAETQRRNATLNARGLNALTAQTMTDYLDAEAAAGRPVPGPVRDEIENQLFKASEQPWDEGIQAFAAKMRATTPPRVLAEQNAIPTPEQYRQGLSAVTDADVASAAQAQSEAKQQYLALMSSSPRQQLDTAMRQAVIQASPQMQELRAKALFEADAARLKPYDVPENATHIIPGVNGAPDRVVKGASKAQTYHQADMYLVDGALRLLAQRNDGVFIDMETHQPVAGHMEKMDARSLEAQLAAAPPEEQARILQLMQRQADATRGPQTPIQVADPTSPTGARYVLPGAAVGQPAPARAGGSRTTRPVTTGDANRIAELRASINDLQTLTQTLQPQVDANGTPMKDAPTGTVAGLEANWTPDFVTNATGFGAAAKARLAVINRVKQVIGKTLEGGVLRKEDEDKYAKILPTIQDPPSVAAAKLEGLKRAIQQRYETELSALEDAGFDVSRFRSREGAVPPGFRPDN